MSNFYAFVYEYFRTLFYTLSHMANTAKTYLIEIKALDSKSL